MLYQDKAESVFGDGPINSLKTAFLKTREAYSNQTAEVKTLKHEFPHIRHWKATMLYHQTKDIYYVRQFLEYKEARNTEIYINIERILFEPLETTRNQNGFNN